METPTTDVIGRQILLRASKGRAWHALTDATEFGAWFGVELREPFMPGGENGGVINHPGSETFTMTLWVQRIEPESSLSFRWHPAANDPIADYHHEPTTLVEFRLEDAPEGTLLTLTESGFDLLPVGRRHEAMRLNSSGWTAHMQNVGRYLGDLGGG